jgi:hypothetical protein
MAAGTTETRIGRTVATAATEDTVVVVEAEEEAVEAETKVTMAVMTARVMIIMAATIDGGMTEGTVVTIEAEEAEEAGEAGEAEVTIGITTPGAVMGRLPQIIPLLPCRLAHRALMGGCLYHLHQQRL